MKKYLYILFFCLLQCVLTGFAQNKHTAISDTINLSEVTVLAERPFVQRKADRMIVSVEHSKLLKARSLSNILSLIPGVSYDGEGGITIMGNGIRIYENGRMVKLSGAQLKRYLSSLRGNDIKSILCFPPNKILFLTLLLTVAFQEFRLFSIHSFYSFFLLHLSVDTFVFGIILFL